MVLTRGAARAVERMAGGHPLSTAGCPKTRPDGPVLRTCVCICTAAILHTVASALESAKTKAPRAAADVGYPGCPGAPGRAWRVPDVRRPVARGRRRWVIRSIVGDQPPRCGAARALAPNLAAGLQLAHERERRRVVGVGVLSDGGGAQTRTAAGEQLLDRGRGERGALARTRRPDGSKRRPHGWRELAAWTAGQPLEPWPERARRWRGTRDDGARLRAAPRRA